VRVDCTCFTGEPHVFGRFGIVLRPLTAQNLSLKKWKADTTIKEHKKSGFWDRLYFSMIWFFAAVVIVALLLAIKVYLSGPVIHKNVPLSKVDQYLDSLDVQCKDGSFLNIELKPNKNEILQVEKLSDGFCFIASNLSWSVERLDELKVQFSSSGEFSENDDASVHHIFCQVCGIKKAKELLNKFLEQSEVQNVARLYIDGTLMNVSADEIVSELTKRGFNSDEPGK